jgi:hypothetical protein
MEHRWNETDRGKPKYSGKNLSTTNPTWTNPESNPGLHGERPATNRLSHGTTYLEALLVQFSTAAMSKLSRYPNCDIFHFGNK